MNFIGEIDIHDLRYLPSNYKFKDINDEAEFYVIRIVVCDRRRCCALFQKGLVS